MIHALADVQSPHIGENTRIWQFAVVLDGAVIGGDCNINCHTFIENDVIIGDRVTVKSGVYLWDGLRVENDVFIGPNATFVNDPYPRSKQYPGKFQNTILKTFCSIGAGATILGGLEIGSYALIAAGSVVTKNVRAHALMVGNPARQSGWVNIHGEKLKQQDDHQWSDSKGNMYEEINGALVAK